MAQDSDRTPLGMPTNATALSSLSRIFAGSRQNLNSTPPATPSVSGNTRPRPGQAAPPSPERVRAALGRANAESSFHDGTKDSRSVGVPPELDQLVEDLGKQNNVSDRMRTARQITTLLASYPIQNVSEIWQRGRDISQLDESKAMAVGFQLLGACVRHKTLVARERLTFIEAIMNDQREAALSYRLDILKDLTRDGRYLDHIEIFIAPCLVQLLEQTYLDFKGRNKRKEDPPDYCEETLDFVLSVIKFNAKVLEEKHLITLLEEVLAIASRTSISRQLRKCMDIVDAVITYSELPQSMVRLTLEVICPQYAQDGEIHDRAAKTLNIILRNHYGRQATADLLDIAQDSEMIVSAAAGSKSKSQRILGAVIILRHIMCEEDDSNFKKPSLSVLLQSLERSMEAGNPKISNETMQLVLDIVKSSHLYETLFDEEEWRLFREIMSKALGREGAMHRIPAGHTTIANTQLVKPYGPSVDMLSMLRTIFDHLAMLCDAHDLRRMRLIMEATMEFLQDLDDSSCTTVIQYYVAERLLWPSGELDESAADAWYDRCDQLRLAVFAEPTRSTAIRMNALKVLYDAAREAGVFSFERRADDFLRVLLASAVQEEDIDVLEELCNIATDLGTWTTNEMLFTSVYDTLRAALFTTPPAVVRPSSSEQVQNDERGTSGSRRNVVIANCMVRLFLRNLNRSGDRTLTMFSTLVHLANSPTQPPDARIVAMKLIARIRSDSSCAIFIVPETGCESIAAALCRTADSVLHAMQIPESPIVRPSRPNPEEPNGKRPTSGTPSTPHPARAGLVTRSITSVGGLTRLSKPNPPLWMYGSSKGLPEDPPARSSHLVFSYLDPTDQTESDKHKKVVLPIRIWFDLVVAMLQRKDLEWETYSYMLVHLGAQLTNHSVMIQSFHRVQDVANLILRQLGQKISYDSKGNKILHDYHTPPAHTNLRKSDVAICLYHILTMLISYKEHIAYDIEDKPLRLPLQDIVDRFIDGVGSGERTSEVCIHALAVCCHELPVNVTKKLEALMAKFAAIITQSQLTVHILEFLAGLARVPELFQNFRDSDYSNVFSICIRYLEYVRDQKTKQNRFSTRSARASMTPIKTNIRGTPPPPTPDHSTSRSLADELPQYVYALAYHVIVFWFMSLRLRDRPHHMLSIQHKLLIKDGTGRQSMDEQGQVTMDFLHRITYSDRDETAPKPDFARPADGVVNKKSWIVGKSIVTVETASRTGKAQITRRRPSGTRYSIFTPNLIRPPRHQAPMVPGVSVDEFYSGEYVGILPDDFLAEVYSPEHITYDTPVDMPISLPDDESTQRTINTFDRISALDGHKVGIIYVGEGQHDEVTILSNVMGSEDYTSFLSGIGTLIQLKGATFNTQGLDREFDTDGKFTFCWRNRVTELVFHVTTMMPTNLEHDPRCALKKRHTGNDFVNIIWNNSGAPFDFNTFPSDFNYVNIIITPEARTSFVETRLYAAERLRRMASQLDRNKPSDDGTTPTGSEDHSAFDFIDAQAPLPSLFYRVTVVTAPNIPAISSAAETKIVSGASLPAFVRLLALNASVFCGVWSGREIGGGLGEHVSSWRSRLREINRLRERFEGTLPDRPSRISAAASVEFGNEGSSGVEGD